MVRGSLQGVLGSLAMVMLVWCLRRERRAEGGEEER